MNDTNPGVRATHLDRPDETPLAVLREVTQPQGLTDVTPSVRYTSLEAACAVEYPRLVRLLTLYCGDREAALDLAQETCVRGCRCWPSVSQMSDQRGWFTKVALNLGKSRWRRLALERRALAVLGSRPALTSTSDVARAVTVRAALATLTLDSVPR
jgi:DNA-directed RNA polymerase specialized sigma24 family protein